MSSSSSSSTHTNNNNSYTTSPFTFAAQSTFATGGGGGGGAGYGGYGATSPTSPSPHTPSWNTNSGVTGGSNVVLQTLKRRTNKVVVPLDERVSWKEVGLSGFGSCVAHGVVFCSVPGCLGESVWIHCELKCPAFTEL